MPSVHQKQLIEANTTELFKLLLGLPTELSMMIVAHLPEKTCYKLLLAVDIAENAIKNSNYSKVGKLSINFSELNIQEISLGLSNIHAALVSDMRKRFSTNKIYSGYGASSYLTENNELRISGQWGFQSYQLFQSRIRGASSFFVAKGVNKTLSIVDIVHGPRKLAVVFKLASGEKEVHIFGQNQVRLGVEGMMPRIEGYNGYKVIKVGKSQKSKVSFGAQHMIIWLDDKVVTVGWNMHDQLGFTKKARQAQGRDFIEEEISFADINIDPKCVTHVRASYFRTIIATKNKIFITGKLNKDFQFSFRELDISDMNISDIYDVLHLNSGVVIHSDVGLFSIGNVFTGCPQKIEIPKEAGDIVKLSAGNMHVIALCSNGVYGFGDNTWNQINMSKDNTLPIFTKLEFEELNHSKVSDIAAVGYSTLIVCNGRVYGVGDNSCSHLGVMQPRELHSCISKVSLKSFENISQSLHRVRYEQQMASLIDEASIPPEKLDKFKAAKIRRLY